MENMRRFMRDDWRSNGGFQDHDAPKATPAGRCIVAHCCHAWIKRPHQPWRIMPIRSARTGALVLSKEH